MTFPSIISASDMELMAEIVNNFQLTSLALGQTDCQKTNYIC